MKLLKKFSPTLIMVWPLLLGMFMIMVGNGLQGTLLSLRAEADGFSISVIGIIMSLYYCGYLAGWHIIPPMINSVGHIRVFAGFASMASTTILLQGLFVDPYTWSIVRFISGLSFVGLFIVAESWLNNITTNDKRAQTLGTYIFVVNAGLFGGQFLVNLAPIENIELFALISILISLSLLPITLADKPSPGYKEVEKLPFKKLVATAPLAVICVCVCGFTTAAMLTIGPVYASTQDFPIPKISLFIGLYVLGCAIIPLFTGWLSDQIERRKVLITLCFCGCTISIFTAINPNLTLFTVFFIGGCATSIYSIGVAMMNDRLLPSQMTSATASLILLSGIGSCLAPLSLGTLMDIFGPITFFASFTGAFGAAFLFGSFRALTKTTMAAEDQRRFQLLPTRSAHGIARMTHRKREEP